MGMWVVPSRLAKRGRIPSSSCLGCIRLSRCKYTYSREMGVVQERHAAQDWMVCYSKGRRQCCKSPWPGHRLLGKVGVRCFQETGRNRTDRQE